MSIIKVDSSNNKGNGKRKANMSPTPLVKTKKSKETSTESVDLAKGYGWVLKGIAMSWIYNDDGGCFMDVCTKEINVIGPWIIIYQPHKSMIEYDDYVASIIIKRVDKTPITRKMFTDAKPYLKQVEKLYLESYNDILAQTDNKWTHPVDGTFNQIAQIKKPLALKDDQIKMQFEIRMPTNHSCGDSWEPAKLLEWLGESTLYTAVSASGEIQNKEELEKFNKPAKPAIIN